ncbi:MAG: SEL1-like repeat protein [Proteobacteria bacterium]|nr:SEL1-like repeat protein [Pseudomonadota bacterium]
MFFSPSRGFTGWAWAADEEKSAEIIICPETRTGEIESPLNAYYLARAYDKGYCGIKSDKGTAIDWYARAAEQGHMLAQYQLGEIYFTGEGLESSDYPKAKQWYLGSALQGYGPAQLRLAFLYAEAHFKGLTPDYAEAEKWFLKAAEQNAGDAQFRLGNFYHNYKTPPDIEKAILWLTRAAEGGHRVAMFDLARLLKDRKESGLALDWMKKSADQDFLPAQMALSEMYAAGDGAPYDPTQSLIWTLKVAMHPMIPTYWLLKAGDIFFDGWDTIPKDYLQATQFYKRAADKDDPHALTQLGRIYLEGLGTPINKEKALGYLKKAAGQKDKEAMEILAHVAP